MHLIDELAEQRILEARDRGELDNLPGSGKPQQLEDDSLVPEHLRAGYRLLKNAGFLPPEMQWRREVASVEDLLRSLPEDDAGGERSRAERRLQVLLQRLAAGRHESPLWLGESDYTARLLQRLSRR